MKPNSLIPKTAWRTYGRPVLPKIRLTPDQQILKGRRHTSLEDDLIKMGMAPVAKTLHALDRDTFQKHQG